METKVIDGTSRSIILFRKNSIEDALFICVLILNSFHFHWLEQSYGAILRSCHSSQFHQKLLQFQPDLHLLSSTNVYFAKFIDANVIIMLQNRIKSLQNIVLCIK